MNQPYNPARANDPTEVIVTVPLDPAAKVAGIIRPPRPLTVGRRESDRWLAWSIVALLAIMLVFVVYVSWELEQYRQQLSCR